MTYTYLEHAADMGILAKGSSLEEAFESGAEAMLNLIFDTGTINPKVKVDIRSEARDIPMLFVEVLNEILCKLDIEGLAIKMLKAGRITKENGTWFFRGLAYGEPFQPDRHPVKTEVKAATYASLSYNVERGKHRIQCILDV